MTNHVCRPCWEAALKRGDQDRENLIKRLAIKFKDDKGIKTIAIVRTQEKGYLTWRKIGDPSIKDLKVVEYISFMQGIAI